MKKFLMKIIIYAGGLLFSLMTFGAQNPSTQHVIDFSQSNNLKVIFDAGLRPKQLVGLNDQCELGNENLKIILSKVDSFEMNIDSASIRVLAGNQIYRIELQGEFTSFANAAPQIDKLCQSLGIQSKKFDEYAVKINHGQQQISSPGGFLTKKNGIDIQVGFDPPMLSPNPKTRIWIILIWPVPDEKMKFLTEPIKPPPGYENVSMDEPTDNTSQVSSPPQSSPQQTSATLHNQAVATTSTTNISPIQNPTKEPAAAIGQAKNVQPASSTIALLGSWSWLVGLLAVLAIIAVIYVIKKK